MCTVFIKIININIILCQISQLDNVNKCVVEENYKQTKEFNENNIYFQK